MKLKCTQCGADIPIEQNSGFVVCPYCESSLFVELDQTVRHYTIQPALKPDSLALNLQRHLASLELKSKIKISKSKLIKFPFWQLTVSGGQKLIIPACTTSLESLREVDIPAGKLTFFDPSGDDSAEILEPEILLEGVLAQLGGNEIKEAAGLAELVHLPIYFIEYEYLGRTYDAAVDAVSGKVYADEIPPSPSKAKDSFFGAMILLTFVIYFVEGLILKDTWMALTAYAVTSAPLYLGIRAALQRKGW